MSYIYKTIIVGATPQGLELAKLLATTKRNVVLVSENFIYKNKTDTLENIDIVEDKAIFLSFSHGLFGVALSKGGNIYGCSIVFATGTYPSTLPFKGNGIYYKAVDIKNKQKMSQAIVYGDNQRAVKNAIALAKKFSYIYLCTPTFEICNSKRLEKKLNETINIAHLPSCHIKTCKHDIKTKDLFEVQLDTYDTIKASALVIDIGRYPDLPDFADKYIDKDTKGFAITKDFESTKIPNVFAIGDLLQKCSNKDLQTLSQIIKNRF